MFVVRQLHGEGGRAGADGANGGRVAHELREGRDGPDHPGVLATLYLVDVAPSLGQVGQDPVQLVFISVYLKHNI